MSARQRMILNSYGNYKLPFGFAARQRRNVFAAIRETTIVRERSIVGQREKFHSSGYLS